MNRFARVALPSLLFVLLPLCAQADPCGGLQVAASLKLESDAYDRAMIPVTLNGTPRKFLFDTGGVISQISPAVVKELKLKTRSSNIRLFDANGNVADKIAIVDEFAYGPFKRKDLQFMVSSIGDDDGILTPSLFQNVDIDIDFGPRRLNVILSDHCPGKVIYWKAVVVATVPVTMRDSHLNIPVTVDGHVLRAIIDTGASGTFMRASVAHQLFGLTPQSPGMEPGGYVNGDKETPAFRHSFSSLSFEGIAVANPRVLIAPDRTGAHDLNNDFKTGSFIQHVDDDMEHPDIVIGMNVLSKLHIYFATKEKKLYITPAGAPDEPSPFAPPAK